MSTNNSFFCRKASPSALPCSSQVIPCSLLLYPAGVESQRDQSRLLQGYNLWSKCVSARARGRKMDFSLITVGDDVLIRYDALAPCRGWSCVSHLTRKHQKAQRSHETSKIARCNYTRNPQHRGQSVASSPPGMLGPARTHARTHSGPIGLQLFVM